jgi:type IV pilus assembly protein PilQ
LSLVGCAPATSQAPAAISPPSTPASPAVITDVSTEARERSEQVVVRATGPLKYTAFKLQEPPRLVIDIAEARLDEHVQTITPSGALVQRIEPETLPEDRAVRLTLYLQRAAAHTVEAQAQQLRITFTPHEAQAARQEAQRGPTETVPAVPAASDTLPPIERATASGVSEKTTVSDVSFVPRPETSVLALQTVGELPRIRVKQREEPLRLLLEVEDAVLGSGQARTEAITDPGGVVTGFRVSQATHGADSRVYVVAYLQEATSFDVRQDDGFVRLLIAKPTAAAAVPAAATNRPPQVSSAAAAPPPGDVVASAVPSVPIVAQVTAPEATSGMVPGQPSAGLGEPMTLKEPKGPVYTGEKISLDFQNADINDILRLIAEVSGLNIIAGADVQGTITTRMVDVPWDQALDVILKVNGLSQEREGNIIRVAPTQRFITERQQRMQAQRTEDEVEPTITQLVPVNYADAKELKSNLERLLSNRGSLNIDTRTNTLIVTDTRKHLDDVLALVEKLDRQTPQVMIEARIVETSRNFLRDLGVQLGASYANTTDVKFPNRIALAGTASDTGNFLVDLPAAVGLGSGGAITFALAGANSLINLRLSALESTGRGKIISNPKIATLDNTEALIESGRRIPVQTVSAEGTQTEFVDASLSLRVTPHVTPDGFINMNIRAAKNEADFGNAVNGIPTIITREATTVMLVRDSDTVVIGGLYSRSLATDRSGVPWLSQVPVVGWLFQKTRVSDDNDELLIFITPKIIQPSGPPTAARTAGAY